METLSPPIETDRLILRALREADADAMVRYHSRPDVVRYMYWSERSRADVMDKIPEWAGQAGFSEAGQMDNRGVVLKDSGELIGEVVLILRDAEARQAELGFVFNPDYQGQGYATEAARAMLREGFGPLGMHRIFSRCDTRNTPSWKLMERLGMRREAHFREHALFKGGWDEEFYYALLEDEWRAMQEAAH